MKSIIRGILLSLTLVFTFSACENPVGLGSKVNTEKPVIRNAGDENQPGAFIQGNGNRIWLDVEQEFGIDKVYMEVEYINKTTGATERKTIDAVYAVYDEETGQWKWYVDLDTSDMEDGTIKAWVTAIDINGNTTTTTDIVYFVKNTPPQIKLNMPLVDGDNWDNLPVEGGIGYLDNLINSDPLFLGFDLMGLATDNYGIEKGYPKIMLWPAPDQDFSIQVGDDGLPMPSDARYGTWRSLIVPNERDGLTATKFSWPMVYLIPDASAPGGYRQPVKGEIINSLNPGRYRLRIVTKDLFGNENYYPDRKDTTRGLDNPSPKFIEISYKASDVPIIQYTDYPQYYNAVPDLKVNFTVSSQTLVTGIEASIVNTNDANQEVILGGPYTPALLGQTNAVYRYELTVPAAQAKAWSSNTDFPSTGILFVKAQAVAGDKTGPNTYQNFIFDDKPPSVIIDRPVNLTNKVDSGDLVGGNYEIWYPDFSRPKWVTGTIAVAGAVDDNLTLIKDVYFHIGKLGDDDPSADRASIYGTEANWTNSNVQYSDKYSDPAGFFKWSGSLYSWTCTFEPFDNEYKTTPEGIAGTQRHTELRYGFLGNTFSETESTGRKRFYLPFYVKVVDSANNYKIIHYKLSVDPLLDEPIVTITQPEVKGGVIPIVGGTVRVSGYAEDNYWMHTVLIRVQKFGGASSAVGGYPPGTVLDNNYYIPNTTPPTLPFYKNTSVSNYPRPMKSDGVTPDIDGWFIAEKQGDSANVNWYALINQNQELNPTSDTVKVMVEVVAIDCAQSDTTHNTVNIIGPVETLELKFSKDVPMINNVKIKKSGLDDRGYTEGIKASEVFSFSFDVEAINNINTLTVRVNGAATPIQLINGTTNQTVANWTITQLTPSSPGKNNRNVTILIDSTAASIPGLSVPGFTYGNTGTLTFEVTAVDATENRLSTTNTFVVGVDNFYPTAVINTLNIASDNPPAAKYYFVEGTAQDYPNTGSNLVQGLDKVLVYFEKARIEYDAGNNRKVTGTGEYVRPNGTSANVSTDFITYPKVLFNEGPSSSGITSPNTTNYTRFPRLNPGTPLKSPSAIVVDSPENGATLDVDIDGSYGEIWNGQSSAFKEFGARVAFTATSDPAISSSWADGPYIVHYMILDQAGNATHYQNDIYLENKKPRITQINFGTDIDGNGSVANNANVQEYLYSTDNVINLPNNSAAYGAMTLNNPYFRIRGNRFAVRFTVEKGNGNKGANVTYVEKGANISATSMQRGRVYTIVDQGSGWSYTDFTKYGAPNNIGGTTFVATGSATVSPPPSGTSAGTAGTVTTYTSRTDGSHRFPVSMAAAETNGTITITNFNNISDSHKDSSGDVDQHNERLFILKVFDTTISNETSPDGWDQLADAILVKVDIDNKDDKAPSLEVLPFGYEYNVDPTAAYPNNNPANYDAKKWKLLNNSDYNKNIGMNKIDNVDVRGGYVQYSYSIYPNIDQTGTADISGKIKFLGKAEDNQRIESIWVTIAGYNGGSPFQIAQTSNFRIIPVTNPAGDWVFTVLDDNYQTLEFGHSFSWEFMWDSSKHSSVAANGVNITFEVRDAAAPYHPKTALKSVNIVPYISEVVTSFSTTYYQPSVFNRSALGGYPVKDGESILVRGFNLGTDVKIGSTSLGNITVEAGAKGGIRGTVPNVDSGPLVVTVNGVVSFNNVGRKQKSAHYNQEPNGVNNNILDNSRYIYVWNTGSLYTTEITQLSNPFMRMDNAGNRYMSYGNYNIASSGRLRVRKNNTDYYIGDAFSNRMVYTTVGIGGSNASFYALGTDLSSSANDNRGFQLGLSNAAGNNSINGNGTAAGGNGANFGNLLITKTNDANPERYKIPRIAVRPGAGSTRSDTAQDRLFISYYVDDSSNPGIEVIYVNVGTTDVTTSPGTTVPAPPTGNTGYRSFDASVKVRVTNGTTYKGSIYTAAGLLSNGNPVIAWYENETQELIFSFNTSASSSGNWVTNAKVIAEKMGTHVDMAVDANDNVHLAYYSDDGGLWYTYIPSGDVLNTGRPDPTPVRVDTFLSSGTKPMINVRGGIPYISYAHSSFPGTRHSIRVAWRVSSATTAHGTFEDDTFTGNWEVMTVPVRSNIIPNIDEFVCNGVPTSGNLIPPASEKDSLTYSSALNQTILVGFMTNSSYDGAVLKDNITTVPPILQKPTP